MSAPEKDGLEYRFEQIRQCEMCEAPSKDFVTMGVRQNRSQGFRPRRGIGIAVTVQRCSECGLIFSNPMPVPKRMEMHYPDRPEEYWASAYLDEPLEQVFAGSWLPTDGFGPPSQSPWPSTSGPESGDRWPSWNRMAFESRVWSPHPVSLAGPSSCTASAPNRWSWP